MFPLPIFGGAVGVGVLIGIALVCWWRRRQTISPGVCQCVWGGRARACARGIARACARELYVFGYAHTRKHILARYALAHVCV